MIRNALYICLFLLNLNLSGQSIELRDQYFLTNKLFKENDYLNAYKANEKAIMLSQKEFGSSHLTTATLLENKGRLLLKLNKFKQAEEMFIAVIEVRKKLLDSYNPAIAEALDYLAFSLRKQENFVKSEKTHDKVLSIMANVIANNPGQISELSRRSALYRARAFHTKGDHLVFKKKFSDALGNYKTAIKIYERTLGKNKKELNELREKLIKYKHL